jgi:lipoprotein-anchoring transpeptidase ErfK/SrfK
MALGQFPNRTLISSTGPAVAPRMIRNSPSRASRPRRRWRSRRGPKNPVGSVWIDLSKDSYGIHGTAHPETIGKTGSHGCVRLTNWDATELAHMVSKATVVVFLD